MALIVSLDLAGNFGVILIEKGCFAGIFESFRPQTWAGPNYFLSQKKLANMIISNYNTKKAER